MPSFVETIFLKIEFTFIENDGERGYFEKTDRNEYNNEDLDVPTYLLRGIKIKIK